MLQWTGHAERREQSDRNELVSVLLLCSLSSHRLGRKTGQVSSLVYTCSGGKVKTTWLICIFTTQQLLSLSCKCSHMGGIPMPAVMFGEQYHLLNMTRSHERGRAETMGQCVFLRVKIGREEATQRLLTTCPILSKKDRSGKWPLPEKSQKT